MQELNVYTCQKCEVPCTLIRSPTEQSPIFCPYSNIFKALHGNM